MSFAILGSGWPYSTPLRLGLSRFPGPAPLGLTGRAMGAATVPTGKDGWDYPGRPGRGARMTYPFASL
jgi:hypothetical protein